MQSRRCRSCERGHRQAGTSRPTRRARRSFGHEHPDLAAGRLLHHVRELVGHLLLEAPADLLDRLALAAFGERLLRTGERFLEHDDDEVLDDVGLRLRRALAVVLGLKPHDLPRDQRLRRAERTPIAFTHAQSGPLYFVDVKLAREDPLDVPSRESRPAAPPGLRRLLGKSTRRQRTEHGARVPGGAVHSRSVLTRPRRACGPGCGAGRGRHASARRRRVARWRPV